MESPRILAVDDTPRDLDLLAQILEQQGYQLTLARDGAGAVEMATRDRPDLVLLDILMPGMDGIEVCRQLKADPATLEIPVIFLSAQSKPEDILSGFEVGAVDYVTKPFQIPELLARVHVHVKLRRAQQEIRTLRGFLPTCAHCKKIRDEQGLWHDLESYITEHSEAQFSHGLCPDCIPMYFPDYHKGAPAQNQVAVE